jgi:hypothetical protein
LLLISVQTLEGSVFFSLSMFTWVNCQTCWKVQTGACPGLISACML